MLACKPGTKRSPKSRRKLSELVSGFAATRWQCSSVHASRAERRIEGKWPVSREGGNAPVWRQDGRELIFRSVSGAPMAVNITLTATTFQAGMPKQLFPTPTVPWSVTRDGKRFLVSMPPLQDGPVRITIELNWEAALKR